MPILLIFHLSVRGFDMGDFLHTQNSFANGEISPEFFARENMNGLSKLENMDVLSSGGLSRRRGLEQVVMVSDAEKLIPFSVGENDDYLLAIGNETISIYKDGIRVRRLISAWNLNDLDKLQYAQRFGTMIFVHPDYRPQILKKTESSFELSNFNFSDDASVLQIPFLKFDDVSDVKITITGNSRGSNYATFTADSDCWSVEHVGDRLMAVGKQWTVIECVSPRVAVAGTNGSWVMPTAPVADWREAAFGNRRGWPVSITFHQDRLVFGGSRGWPSGVWMSKVGNHNNFDTGTGLDDEAIFITLLSDKRHQICTVVSSDNLQILTNVGEWAISNKPLTPASVNIKQHTSVGSIASRYLPPQKVEGRTMFVSGTEIRELTLDELGEKYNAVDLCALSKHLMNHPIDLAYNDETNQLFVVMKDGKMAVLNKNENLGIGAWGTYTTAGEFKSVAVIGGKTFAIVARGDETFIERFSAAALDDCGTGFSYMASGLPLLSAKHAPRKIRLKKIAARVLNTKSLFINDIRVVLPNDIYVAGAPGYNGDVSVNLLGTTTDVINPLWMIFGNESFPATVLSITMNGYYII